MSAVIVFSVASSTSALLIAAISNWRVRRRSERRSRALVAVRAQATAAALAAADRLATLVTSRLDDAAGRDR